MSDPPFASREVRWFFEHSEGIAAELEQWIRTSAPLPGSVEAGRTEWQGRAGDAPDLYLLVPGSDDMGIKWREGLLQIKGRVENVGDRQFGDHEGAVERWIKWSYAGLPESCRALFANSVSGEDPRIVAVRKRRLLRLIRVADNGDLLEAEPGEWLDRGIGLELTEIGIGGSEYLSVGVEAFPDDEVVEQTFDAAVATLLSDLTTTELALAQSASYPAWLDRLEQRQ